MKKALMILLPVAALRLLCGCVATEEPLSGSGDGFYRRAALHLEQDGTFYHISSSTDLYGSLAVWMKEVRSAIAVSDNPGSVRLRFQGMAAGAELLCRLSGLRDCAGFGASSFRIKTAEGRKLFRNRKYFSPVKDGSGWLWDGKNPKAPRLAWLASLPENTVAALSFDIDPALLLAAAERAGKGRAEADKLAMVLFGVPADKLAAGVAGDWRLYVTFDSGSKELWSVVLEIPDRGYRLFERFRAFAKAVDGQSVSGESVTLGSGRLPQIAPTALKLAGERLAICSSAGAAAGYRANLAGKMPRLGAKAAFRELASGMAAESSGIIYSDFSGGVADLVPTVNVAGITAGNSPFNAPELEVFEFTPEREWVVTGHSTIDLNSSSFARFVLAPAMAVLPWMESAVAAKKLAREKQYRGPAPAVEAAPEVVQVDKSIHCVGVLKKHAAAIADECKKDNGKGAAGIAGWLKAQNVACPAADGRGFISLGDVPEKAPEKWPLLLDAPENHKDSFNVLYLSGECRRVQLERQGSVKRMISALHALHPYEESVLTELIRRADAADKTLNGSEKK